MKSLKPKFNTIFIQDWGTFSNETLVCVNRDKAQILRYMRQTRVKPELIERFEAKPESDAEAFVWSPSDMGCTMLWLREWAGDLEDLNTLVHETNHLVFDISRDKGFKEEAEIQAYQQAYLFSGVLEKLTARRKQFNAVKALKSKTKKVENGNENA
jgi:hypothetical protein